MASGHSLSFRFAKFALKVGIGVGAIYLTVVEGLWSHSASNSDAVYNRVKSTFLPQLNQAEKIAAEDRLSNLRVSIRVIVRDIITTDLIAPLLYTTYSSYV